MRCDARQVKTEEVWIKQKQNSLHNFFLFKQKKKNFYKANSSSSISSSVRNGNDTSKYLKKMSFTVSVHSSSAISRPFTLSSLSSPVFLLGKVFAGPAASVDDETPMECSRRMSLLSMAQRFVLILCKCYWEKLWHDNEWNSIFAKILKTPLERPGNMELLK